MGSNNCLVAKKKKKQVFGQLEGNSLSILIKHLKQNLEQFKQQNL